ncbi:MAG: methylated-DNA--[protein]-cysteine S-methyltransferase [Bacillota bacterium]
MDSQKRLIMALDGLEELAKMQKYKETKFQRTVWDAISTIPSGETRSYKQIAEQIGNPNAVRAVGAACNKNPLPVVVPCHRVVGSDGNLVGYAHGVELKEKLLNIERRSNREVDIKLFEQLKTLSEDKYRQFLMKLIPNTENILGVRTPKLRQLAKEIAKGDWREFLSFEHNTFHEELILETFVLGYAKMDFLERLVYAQEFVPKIRNWAVCDSFCSSIKAADEDLPLLWAFIEKYLCSNEEYEVRFGIVTIICNFIREDYIDRAFSVFDNTKHDGYYVTMAVGWAIAEFFTRFPERTLNYLKNNSLEKKSFNKAIQKITESLKVDDETKGVLRKLKLSINIDK